jgi:thiopeptide-type bacteriocin biosynthesis protein
MKKLKRSFVIGSEWVYYKIYTGPKTADLILTDFIKPIADKLLKHGVIKKWFFIRYADPEFHLRVRFQLTIHDNIGKIINDFYTSLNEYLSEDLIWKVQLDTYHREVERYGDNTIIDSEKLFYHDSEMITNLLDLIDDDDEGEELRWLFGIRSIDQFLNDFSYSEDEKYFLLEALKINFGQEFHINNFLKKQLDKKYSKYQEKIAYFLELNEDDNSDFKPLLEIINIKSTHSYSSIENIKKSIKPEQLNSFMGSQIHMIMNRLFRSKNRLHELTIYYFLFKYYPILWGKRKYYKSNKALITKL